MRKNEGLVGLIIVLIVAILIASYFGISIRQVAESPTGQSNFGYIKEVSLNFWHSYLEKPALYVYNNILRDLIWDPFITNLNRLKSGQGTTIDPPTVVIPQS